MKKSFSSIVILCTIVLLSCEDRAGQILSTQFKWKINGGAFVMADKAEGYKFSSTIAAVKDTANPATAVRFEISLISPPGPGLIYGTYDFSVNPNFLDYETGGVTMRCTNGSITISSGGDADHLNGSFSGTFPDGTTIAGDFVQVPY